jgi:hypothetical protein
LTAEGTAREDDASPVGFEALGFRLDRHIQDVCGDDGDSGFGSLLFTTRGTLAVHDDTRTWLYVAERRADGPWASAVRSFDLDSGTVGAKTTVLSPAEDDRWAVLHHAIEVSDDLTVALYSNGHGLRAAYADRPDGPFTPDPEFLLLPGADWEHCVDRRSATSLEANGCYLSIEENDDHLVFWEGYDSYCPSELGGQLAWARLALDKRRRRMSLQRRHPGNPLSFLPPAHLCARCGGNLAGDVRIDGMHAYFYYTRPSRNDVTLHLALSRDPLFQHIDAIGRFDGPRGDEELVEKFQAYQRDGALYLIYESRLGNGSWRTGLRRYRCP